LDTGNSRENRIKYRQDDENMVYGTSAYLQALSGRSWKSDGKLTTRQKKQQQQDEAAAAATSKKKKVTPAQLRAQKGIA
jgi:hypothetical protein